MDQTTLLLARCFSVAATGLFSYAMIDLVVSDRLKYYLADQKFELLVIIGGVLLALVVILKLRGLVMGVGHSHDHDHDHGGEGHEHGGGVSLWRFIVLSIPLMIILIGLAPAQGLSEAMFEKRMTRSQRDAIATVGASALPPGRRADGEIVSTDARVLEEQGQSANTRAIWESTTTPIRARLAGQFVPDGRFTDRYRLMRIKITCCAADAAPIGVTVLGKVNPEWQYGQWLEITGPVSFAQVDDPKTGKGQFFPVIHQQQVEYTSPKMYLQ